MIEEIFKNISYSQIENIVFFHEGEIYKYYDQGLSRYVFVNEEKTKVIKVQIHPEMDDNEKEFNVYNKASEEDKEKMAHTKLIGGLIEQEYVIPIKWAGKSLTEEQKKFALSCRKEVGFRKDGTLVCFDLSDYKKY